MSKVQMEQITSSYNLFVDSSRGHTTGSKGDDFMINLQDAGVKAGEGEHIRMNLENFSMAKNFSDVNANNNHVRVRGKTGSTFWIAGSNSYVDFELTKRNNKTVFDLASDFKTQLIAALEQFDNPDLGSISVKANSLKPASATALTDNIIEFVLSYSGTQLNTGTSDIYIQFYSEKRLLNC